MYGLQNTLNFKLTANDISALLSMNQAVMLENYKPSNTLAANAWNYSAFWTSLSDWYFQVQGRFSGREQSNKWSSLRCNMQAPARTRVFFKNTKKHALLTLALAAFLASAAGFFFAATVLWKEYGQQIGDHQAPISEKLNVTDMTSCCSSHNTIENTYKKSGTQKKIFCTRHYGQHKDGNILLVTLNVLT